MVNAIINKDNDITITHLRVSSEVFQSIINHMPTKKWGWERELELIAFLFWLASGASYRIVAAVLNIPKPTIFRLVSKLLDFTVSKIFPAVIRLPHPDEFYAIGNKFCQRAGTRVFKDAIGAIDGTHVMIKCPIALHDQYINRKCRYTIQCQAICDSSFKFINVFVGYPGSVHDTRVLYNSTIYQQGIFPPQGYYLLGDSGYPCRTTPISIITPFKETRTLTSQQKNFNHKHSKARITIECAFGQMKTRWRSIFDKTLDLKIEKIVKVIAACCAFHNICVEMKDLMLTNEENNSSDDDHTGISNDQEEGVRFRNMLLHAMENENSI